MLETENVFDNWVEGGGGGGGGEGRDRDPP